MNFLWRIFKGLSAVIGFILVFGAVGTSDYYLLELGQPEPEGIWETATLGVVLMLPLIASMIYKAVKEGDDNAL